jgi:hypothetical protein
MTTYVRSASRALPALWCFGVLASGCGADGPPPEPLAVSVAKSEDASVRPAAADACPTGQCTSQDLDGNGHAFTIFLVGKQESGTFVATPGKAIDWRVRVTQRGDGKTPGSADVGVALLTGPAGMTAKTTAPGEVALAWIAKPIEGGKTSLLFGAWDRDACAKVEDANACARPASPDKLREYLARFGLTFAVGWRVAGQAGSGGSAATGNVAGAGTPGASDPNQPNQPNQPSPGPGAMPAAAPTPAPTAHPTPTPSSAPTTSPGGTPVHTLYVDVKDVNGAYVPGASVHVVAVPGGVVFDATKVSGSASVAFPGVPDGTLDVSVVAAGYRPVDATRVAASSGASRVVTATLVALPPPPPTSLWSCRVCDEAPRNAFGRAVYYFDMTVRAASADAALAAARAMKSSCPASGPAPFYFSGSGACPEICRAPGSGFPEYPIYGAVFPAEGRCNSY